MCLKLTPTILPQWIYKRLQLVYTVSQLEEEIRLCYFRHPASFWCQGKFNANAHNRDQQVFARVGHPVDLYFVVKVRLGCIECISRARVLRPDQTRMRVDESRNSRSRLTANSHQLSCPLVSCTLINFELVQILRRVNERFGSFDRSWELHEINGLHFAVTWCSYMGSTKWPMFLSERFSDTHWGKTRSKRFPSHYP